MHHGDKGTRGEGGGDLTNIQETDSDDHTATTEPGVGDTAMSLGVEYLPFLERGGAGTYRDQSICFGSFASFAHHPSFACHLCLGNHSG